MLPDPHKTREVIFFERTKELRNEAKFVLRLLYEFGTVDCRTRIQNMFYLMKHKYDTLVPFFFVRRLYGHYSSEVSSVIFSLANQDIIVEKRTQVGYSYKLSEGGLFLVKMGFANISKNAASSIKRLKEEGYGRKSLNDVLREVYDIAGIK